MACLFSAKLRACNSQDVADVPVPDFSLAKTISQIEEQLAEGNMLELDDDIFPGAGNDMGTGRQTCYCPSLTAGSGRPAALIWPVAEFIQPVASRSKYIDL